MKLAAVSFAFGLAALPVAAQPVSLDPIFAGYGTATPGCAVGVRHKGEPPLLRGYGSADLEHGVAITPDTVFEAG